MRLNQWDEYELDKFQSIAATLSKQTRSRMDQFTMHIFHKPAQKPFELKRRYEEMSQEILRMVNLTNLIMSVLFWKKTMTIGKKVIATQNGE